jgi:hypothetical protein
LRIYCDIDSQSAPLSGFELEITRQAGVPQSVAQADRGASSRPRTLVVTDQMHIRETGRKPQRIGKRLSPFLWPACQPAFAESILVEVAFAPFASPGIRERKNLPKHLTLITLQSRRQPGTATTLADISGPGSSHLHRHRNKIRATPLSQNADLLEGRLATRARLRHPEPEDRCKAHSPNLSSGAKNSQGGANTLPPASLTIQ